MQNSFNSKTFTPIIIALSLILGIWIGYNQPISSTDANTSTKLNEIFNYISDEYIDSVNLDSIVEKSLPDILAQLDPHSTYIPAKDLQATNDELEGSFSGVGVSFSIMNDTITIIEVIANGPCEKMGVIAGDRIISVDGENVAGISISNEKVMSLLKGPKGTKVKLGIKRSNASTPLSFEITRGEIPVNSVIASYIIAPHIGYIKVDKFGGKTFEEFNSSLHDLKDKGASKFIIDLRGNGGGYMSAAILMANEFLPKDCTIVYTKTRKKETPSNSDGNGSFQNSDIVILIDEYSASASEILAGAIQDNDRGLIIGRRSYGKGLIQNQFNLHDKSAIRLTVGRYFTPSGRCIQKEYASGDKKYYYDIIDRYNHGELYNADSIKINNDLKYKTTNGRIVYGGGGIIPDIFVPNDTSKITRYYISVLNASLFQKFAFDFSDKNRNSLHKCKTTTDVLRHLPSDDQLLTELVNYAQTQKIAPKQVEYNTSKDLILTAIKSLIARDFIGTQAYYEVANKNDKTILEAISRLNNGDSKTPVSISFKK